MLNINISLFGIRLLGLKHYCLGTGRVFFPRILQLRWHNHTRERISMNDNTIHGRLGPCLFHRVRKISKYCTGLSRKRISLFLLSTILCISRAMICIGLPQTKQTDLFTFYLFCGED